jgi:hypothetical protein
VELRLYEKRAQSLAPTVALAYQLADGADQIRDALIEQLAALIRFSSHALEPDICALNMLGLDF